MGVLYAYVNGAWVPIIGGPGGAGGGGGGTGGPVAYVHSQGPPSASWAVSHNLGWFPNVTVVDSGGSEVEGNVGYIDQNSLTLTFSAAFSGIAYLS